MFIWKILKQKNYLILDILQWFNNLLKFIIQDELTCGTIKI